MRPPEALARLKQRLDDAGIWYEDGEDELRGRGEDWRSVWEAFCAAAREPADEPFEHHESRLRVGDRIGYDLLLHESGGSSSVPFAVDFRRQFTFEDEQSDYAGMNSMFLTVLCDRPPDGRVPEAQRWGYAGRRLEGDETHPEFRNWAGWVDSWKRAVEASNSFKVLDDIQPVRWVALQDDL